MNWCDGCWLSTRCGPGIVGKSGADDRHDRVIRRKPIAGDEPHEHLGIGRCADLFERNGPDA